VARVEQTLREARVGRRMPGLEKRPAKARTRPAAWSHGPGPPIAKAMSRRSRAAPGITGLPCRPTVNDMNGFHLNDEHLEAMRAEGDPLADATVAALFEDGGIGSVNRLLRDLSRNDDALPDGIPQALRDYLGATARPTALDGEKRRRAEAIFALHGPAILLVLGFYSLPAAYAAGKGVQVLHRTSYLLERPLVRLAETAQMVVDVMAPGALSPSGRGIRTAQKVRLMHAAVRYHLQRAKERPWDASLGLPINQEDLAGTLMTFSYVVLEGLPRLGIKLSPEDQEAWLHAWVDMGRRLGVAERLLPASVDEARELTALIRKRQIVASPEGQQLAASLLQAMRARLPPGLSGIAGSLVHHFLGRDAFLQQDVAALLGVPRADWTRLLPPALAGMSRLGQQLGADSRLLAPVTRFASRKVVKLMLTQENDGRAPFAIPASLSAAWGAEGKPSDSPRTPAARCPVHRFMPRAALQAA
jgi:hypothetical protein